MITFKRFIIENEEKPKVRLVDHTHIKGKRGDEHHIHYFEITHPSLSHTAVVDVHHSKGDTDGQVNVGNGKNHQHMGNLGSKNVRHVLGRIKHYLPHLEQLYGLRVTGSRKQLKDPDKTLANVSIKHVKPISPSEGEE